MAVKWTERVRSVDIVADYVIGQCSVLTVKYILWLNSVSADCQKRRQHGNLRPVTLPQTTSPLNSECCRCSAAVSVDHHDDVNGELDRGVATVTSADKHHSCSCHNNRPDSELNDSETPHASCKISDATTSDDCSTRLSADCSIDSQPQQHCTSQLQYQLLVVNGTEGNYCATAGRSSSDSCEVGSRSDDAPSVATEADDKRCCGSVAAVDSSSSPVAGESACVANESTRRQNILDAAETFASIIGREIAASFDLKESDVSPPPPPPPPLQLEPHGDDVGGLAAAAGASTNSSSTRVATGLKSPPRRDDKQSEAGRDGPLDTGDIARRVRDILTVNSVGQRQFARYVLGLSQGTVSELLAKPKPWDRLTEKGKESYRRMNQWAADHRGVLSLKDQLNSMALKTNLPSPKGSIPRLICLLNVLGLSKSEQKILIISELDYTAR